MKKDLDTLLAVHFHRHPNMTRLDGLENNVLRNTRQQHGGNIMLQWTDELMTILSVPRFRFVSVGLALCIGLAVSIVMPPAKNQMQLAQVNQDGMNLFAMNSSYLPSSRFENIPQDVK